MKKGSVALTTVILVSGILLTIGITIILVGIDVAKSSRSYFNLVQAEVNAVTCLEESLNKIKKDLAYTGDFSVSFENGSCTASVTNGVGAGIKRTEIISTYLENTYQTVKLIDSLQNPFTITND